MTARFARDATPARAANDDMITQPRPSIEIVEARSPEHVAVFADLVRAFVDFCRARYADRPWMVDTYFQPEALEKELAALDVKYAAPNGALLLALVDGQPAGGVAFRALDHRRCEMKRLFINDAYRGRGLGERLTSVLIGLARTYGFTAMRLEVGDKQPEALALYHSLGFREIKAYYDAPADLLPYLTFMELKL
jgi:ribosomal protein S18 acetylase RimI-like enzyme